MELLSNTGPVFGESQIGLWIYLFLLLPLGLIGAMIYHLTTKSESRTESFFYIGWILFGMLFLPLPYFIHVLQEDTKVEFAKEAGVVRIKDRFSKKTIELPFSDFRGYSTKVKSETDSDGHTSYTYSFFLDHKKSYKIHLLSTKDKEELQKAKSLTKKALPLPIKESPSLSGLKNYTGNPIALNRNLNSLCKADFLKIRAEKTKESCRFHWPVSVHLGLFYGIALPLLGMYFIIYYIWLNSASPSLWLVLAFFVGFFGIFVYVILRSWNATQILEVSKTEISAYIDSPVLGRSLFRRLPAEKVRFAAAELASSEKSLYLLDRNPLEILKAGNAADIAKSALSIKPLIVTMDGLPIQDRLEFLERLLRPAEW